MVASVRVLVTGSSGQIGSFVVDEARRRGWEAKGLDLDADGGERTTVVGDVRDERVIRDALGGVDAVVHCAAQVSVERSLGRPQVDASHNLQGTLSVLEAARAEGVDRVVNVSSAAVYGDPEEVPLREDHPAQPASPYGASKLAAETYARLYRDLHGLEAVSARPFNVYSARQDPLNPYSGVISAFAHRVVQGEPPVVHGAGHQTRDFIHAEDVAGALMDLAVESDACREPVVNVASGEETSILELAWLMARLTGEEDLEPVHEGAREGDIGRSVADTRRMRRLGIEPRVSLEDGLRGVVSSFHQA